MEGNVFSSLKKIFLLMERNCFLFFNILSICGGECRGSEKLYLLGYKGCGCIVVKGVFKRFVVL